ncbi:hypothetical protein [Vibrio lentus]|uniref:hypothetical protein n=1 Tax=Vibrio lentus TaxID=136468 RepID=UPI001D03E81E|nr:hypothetical protein [Vibrio lentus]MCB5464575.1 hypothetical protein [Vibrio lentus]MCC4849656.1 hypothetical protein [Vibrio lentus]
MDYKQLLDNVITPTLHKLGFHSVAAEQLILGTIAQESRAKYLRQFNNGPARGLIQMEPATHKDIYMNYLFYRDDLANKMEQFLTVDEINFGSELSRDEAIEYVADSSLVFNLAYQVAMCRVHYLRTPEALPGAYDLGSMAEYWKKYYNTELGAGTVEEFIEHFPTGIWDMK